MSLDDTWQREAKELGMIVKKGWPLWAGPAPDEAPEPPASPPPLTLWEGGDNG